MENVSLVELGIDLFIEIVNKMHYLRDVQNFLMVSSKINRIVEDKYFNQIIVDIPLITDVERYSVLNYNFINISYILEGKTFKLYFIGLFDCIHKKTIIRIYANDPCYQFYMTKYPHLIEHFIMEMLGNIAIKMMEGENFSLLFSNCFIEVTMMYYFKIETIRIDFDDEQAIFPDKLKEVAGLEIKDLIKHIPKLPKYFKYLSKKGLEYYCNKFELDLSSINDLKSLRMFVDYIIDIIYSSKYDIDTKVCYERAKFMAKMFCYNHKINEDNYEYKTFMQLTKCDNYISYTTSSYWKDYEINFSSKRYKNNLYNYDDNINLVVYK